ncbi:hypothetical protein ACTXT7_007232 [Hymenolepis weldensis]
MKRSRWVVFLVITLIKVVVSFGPLGFKNATLTETGEGVIFEWFQEDAMNKSHAMEFCDSLRLTIPNVRELRYFYKSLNLETNSIFYLQDVIETTTDSPRDDIGERLCITIKISPGNPSNKKAKTPSLFAGSGLMKPISFGPDGSDLGRYDLLPDVPLQRESYKKSQRSQRELKFATTKDDSTETLSADLGPDPKGTETDATGFL